MRYNAKKRTLLLCCRQQLRNCGISHSLFAYSSFGGLSRRFQGLITPLPRIFFLGLRSVCRAAYVGCQPNYKHVGLLICLIMYQDTNLPENLLQVVSLQPAWELEEVE